jgi:hypothetical protein
MQNAGHIEDHILGSHETVFTAPIWRLGYLWNIERACERGVKLQLIFLQIAFDFAEDRFLTEYSQFFTTMTEYEIPTSYAVSR